MDALPKEIFGQVLRELSVVDRLQCEGVNRHWKKTVLDFGWTEQKKLDREIVFEGANDRQKEKFNDESLIALFRRVGKFLFELDLGSFFNSYCRNELVFPVEHCNISSGVCRWLHLLPNLTKLIIRKIDLHDTLEFLPPTLIELQSSGPINTQNLTALSMNCPNLKSIHFGDTGVDRDHGVLMSVMNTFLEKYPRLTNLSLKGNVISNFERNGSLTSLGQLQCLEKLHLERVKAFDDAALTAVATGCRRLRILKIENIEVSEEVIGKFNNHPNLLYLELENSPNLHESVQETINEPWKIRKYKILCSRMLTDDFFLRETLKELKAIHVQLAYSGFPPGAFKEFARVDTLIRRGFLPVLLTALSSTKAVLLFEAAYALLGIVQHCLEREFRDVIQSGIVSKLIELLVPSKNTELLKKYLNILRIIFVEGGSEFRDHCIELGMLEHLLKFVSAATPLNILQKVVRIFETICQVPPSWRPLQTPISMETFKVILPALGELIQNTDITIISLSVRALSHVASRGNEQIQLIINFGVVPRLVSLVDPLCESVQMDAISALANIASGGTEEQRQLMLDLGALKMMPELISQRNSTTNVLRFLAAFAAGKEHQIQALIDTGLVPAIIQIFIHCYTQEELLNEAARAISNIAKYGSSKQIFYLLDCGVIPPFFELFNQYNDELVLILLEGLKNILEKSDTRMEEVCQKIKRYGGLHMIKNLLKRQAEDFLKFPRLPVSEQEYFRKVDVRKVAKEIIDEFFSLDVDQTENGEMNE